MDKLYDRIIWENNTTPALNEDNLNAMSKGIDDIDDRVLSLGSAVLEVIPDLEDLRDNAEQIISDTQGYAESAEQDAQDAADSASAAASDELDAEAWAVGQRNGQDVPPTDPTYHNNAKYWAGQSGTATLSSMADVNLQNPGNGQLLTYNSSSSKWENADPAAPAASVVTYDNTTSGLTATNAQDAIDEVEGRVDTAETSITNKHKVTSKQVTTTGWTSDTTSQSGTTLYKKSVSLNHVYVTTPEVSIGAASGSVLPTTAEQEAYDLVQYVTCDDAVPCLYLYASEVPTSAFYINVVGVD